MKTVKYPELIRGLVKRVLICGAIGGPGMMVALHYFHHKPATITITLLTVFSAMIVANRYVRQITCPGCRAILPKAQLEEDQFRISYTCQSCNTKYLSTVTQVR